MRKNKTFLLGFELKSPGPKAVTLPLCYIQKNKLLIIRKDIGANQVIARLNPHLDRVSFFFVFQSSIFGKIKNIYESGFLASKVKFFS